MRPLNLTEVPFFKTLPQIQEDYLSTCFAGIGEITNLLYWEFERDFKNPFVPLIYSCTPPIKLPPWIRDFGLKLVKKFIPFLKPLRGFYRFEIQSISGSTENRVFCPYISRNSNFTEYNNSPWLDPNSGICGSRFFNEKGVLKIFKERLSIFYYSYPSLGSKEMGDSTNLPLEIQKNLTPEGLLPIFLMGGDSLPNNLRKSKGEFFKILSKP